MSKIMIYRYFSFLVILSFVNPIVAAEPQKKLPQKQQVPQKPATKKTVTSQKEKTKTQSPKKEISKKEPVQQKVVKKEILQKKEVQSKPSPKENQGPQLIGQFKDWVVQYYVENGKKNCYMIGQPKKTIGKYDKRGSVYLLISRQSDGKATKDVVSYVAGYSYKPKSNVHFIFDSGKKIELFTQAERAWAPDDACDKSLIEAMKKGSYIKVKGQSARNTETEDEISLQGFVAAYNAMVKGAMVK